jgi:hypothetical protein
MCRLVVARARLDVGVDEGGDYRVGFECGWRKTRHVWDIRFTNSALRRCMT